MMYQADRTKSRTQWAKLLKDTEYKTFSYPTPCKHGHPALFRVSEGGKCVECVKLKDRKRYVKKLGLTLEEFDQKQEADRKAQELKEEQRITKRVAKLEAKRLAELAKEQSRELRKAEVAERHWWSTKGWRLERKIHRDEQKAEPKYSHIYAIKNTVTGKTYIGSSTEIKNRLAHHVSYIKHGTHHVQDIVSDAEKYGPEAFTIEILSTFPPKSKEERLALERYYIETWEGDLYNKHYRTDNYDGDAEKRAEYMEKAVANFQ